MFKGFAHLFAGFDDDAAVPGTDSQKAISRPRRPREQEEAPPGQESRVGTGTGLVPPPAKRSYRPQSARTSNVRVYDVPSDEDEDDMEDVHLQTISGDSPDNVDDVHTREADDDVHVILPAPSFVASGAPYPTYSAPMELPEDIRDNIRQARPRQTAPETNEYIRTQNAHIYLYRVPQYRFAATVAGALGQDTSDMFLDKKSVAMASSILTRRTAELQQAVRTYTERAEVLAAETQRNKAATDVNIQSVSRLLGKSLPEYGSVPNDTQLGVLSSYVDLLAGQAGSLEPTQIADASALLDRVLDTFSRASQLNALQDATPLAGDRGGSAAVDSVMSVFNQVRYLASLLGGTASATFIPANPREGNASARVELGWNIGRLRITLVPRGEDPGVEYFQGRDRVAAIPSDTDGSDAYVRARDIRTAFTYVARAVDSVPIRSVEKTADAVTAFSNFILAALGGRVIAYDREKEAEMERPFRIAHTGVLTADNKDNVLAFVRDVDGGQSFSVMANMLVLSMQPTQDSGRPFPPTALFTRSDAYYTRCAGLMGLYMLTPPAPYPPYQYLVESFGKPLDWPERWNRAAERDPRVALLKLFAQYHLVRFYIQALIGQLFQIPDTYHHHQLREAEDKNKRALDQAERDLDRISTMRYDGAEYAGLPQLSGVILYDARLSASISQAVQWIRRANHNFGPFDPMRHVIGTDGGPDARDLPADDPSSAFYAFFVRLVAWHLRGNPAAVYVTTMSMTDRQREHKELVYDFRQFDMSPRGQIVFQRAAR